MCVGMMPIEEERMDQKKYLASLRLDTSINSLITNSFKNKKKWLSKMKRPNPITNCLLGQ